MMDYSSLRSSIHTAVENYESYKSQSLRLRLDNISLETPTPSSPSKSHTKRGSLALSSLTSFGSSDVKNSAQTRPTNSRASSNESINRPTSQRSQSVNSPLTKPKRPAVDRRPSSPSFNQASLTSNNEFSSFIAVAVNYEAANYLVDLDFLLLVFDFMRSEHPHTSNNLGKHIKTRHSAKRKLWSRYTTEMQTLARSYTSGKPLPVPSTSSPFSGDSASTTTRAIKDRKLEIARLLGTLESSERTCAESVVSALSHLHAQAIKDIHSRYAMRDPINDKSTSIHLHNERVRVFNQLVKFVGDDLRRVERVMKRSAQQQQQQQQTDPSRKKDKRAGDGGGSGVVEAVESLCIEDYPPYGGK